MGKFWESLSSEAGKDWLARLETPAFTFWAIGALVLLWQAFGSALPDKIMGWTTAPVPTLIAVAIGAVVLVSVSSWLVDQITLSVLRFHEGYWPRWMAGLLSLRIECHQDIYERVKKRRSNLLKKLETQPLDPEEALHLAYLEERIREFPPNKSDIMGTRLGNILRGSETRPKCKYGLDTIICWPRFWLVLSADVRDELTAARAALDEAARLWLWGLCLLIWARWQVWIVPVAVVWMYVCYKTMLSAASIYGQLIEATFDMKRGDLYEALAWPRPANPGTERSEGERLSRYLREGLDGTEPMFTYAEKKPEVCHVQLQRPDVPPA